MDLRQPPEQVPQPQAVASQAMSPDRYVILVPYAYGWEDAGLDRVRHDSFVLLIADGKQPVAPPNTRQDGGQ